MYRACFADGSELRVLHGREAMSEEIRSVCGDRAVDGFARFCDWLTELYELEMPGFVERNYDSPVDLLRPLRPALELVRLGGFGRLGSRIGRFFDDDRLVRLFSFQSLYAGLAPHQALALYAVITYMDVVNGVVVPEGGMHALPPALATAAEKTGVEIRYRAPADRILLDRHDGGPVRGVRLRTGELVAADAVVCTADLPVAYPRLLPGLPPPRRLRRATYSPSAVVWHAGVRGPLPPRAAHHNIHFGAEWDGAFRALLDDGRRMPDPSLLVTVPTVDEPGMAPPDGHVLYVLEPVPNLDGRVTWQTERDRVRDDLAEQIGRFGYPADVQVEALVDPLDWEAAGMERGTPFALNHRFLQTGPFRPANTDRRAPGLVFAGSSTIPGVGVPMVLVSGELAAERVDQHLGRKA
jgi:phytoene desaturase